MVHALGVLEVGRILEVGGQAVGGEAGCAVVLLVCGISVTIGRGDLFFAVLVWKWDVLGPERRIDTVLKDEVRTYV